MFNTTLSRKPHLEEEAMEVEQEEMMEEDDITHQPSQEEKIPRDRQQGVQMYDRAFTVLLYITLTKLSCTNYYIVYIMIFQVRH